MRLTLTALLAALALGQTPVLAQSQIVSPMTGTTANPPSLTPGAAPAAAPTTAPAPAARTARHPRQTLQHRFEAANTTHDGKLTLEQAKAGHMQSVVKNFDAIDTGRKGYVTLDDIHAHNRAQRAAHRAAR